MCVWVCVSDVWVCVCVCVCVCNLGVGLQLCIYTVCENLHFQLCVHMKVLNCTVHCMCCLCTAMPKCTCTYMYTVHKPLDMYSVHEYCTCTCYNSLPCTIRYLLYDIQYIVCIHVYTVHVRTCTCTSVCKAVLPSPSPFRHMTIMTSTCW